MRRADVLGVAQRDPMIERRELAEHVCMALLSPQRRAKLDKFTYNTLSRWAEAATGTRLPEWEPWWADASSPDLTRDTDPPTKPSVGPITRETS